MVGSVEVGRLTVVELLHFMSDHLRLLIRFRNLELKSWPQRIHFFSSLKFDTILQIACRLGPFSRKRVTFLLQLSCAARHTASRMRSRDPPHASASTMHASRQVEKNTAGTSTKIVWEERR